MNELFFGKWLLKKGALGAVWAAWLMVAPVLAAQAGGPQEADAQIELPQGFALLDRRETGDTQVVFARFVL